MSDITERLRHFCTDWDGSQMDDHTDPMPGLHCTELREAAAEIDQLRAQVAEMREDVARYRWLRDNVQWQQGIRPVLLSNSGPELDFAIDSARQSGTST